MPSTQETFDIYYTEEITLKNPNSTNPYKEIKGVLMEFELQLLYLKMRFVANHYQEIENNNFNAGLNENSRQVTRWQMTQILKKLME